MRMSLVLVADNSVPPSVPSGYRQSLAAGTCQKCLLAVPGVRTVGVRRTGEVSWKRLAMCAACAALAREQGYPVMS
jgi:hypothetical protein